MEAESFTSHEPKPMTSMTVREHLMLYERLELQWSTFILDFENGRKEMKGAWNKDRKCLNNFAKWDYWLNNPKPDNALHLYLTDSNLEVIDLDADTPETAHIMKLAKGYCNFMAKTRKGYHLYFKSGRNFQTTINTERHIDLITDTGKAMIIIAPPTSYTIDDKRQIYKWLLYPGEREDINPMPQALIDYLRGLGFSADSPPVKKPIQESAQTTTMPPPATSFEDVNLLCDCLTPDWLKDMGNFLKLGYCLKALRDDDDMLTLFLDTAGKAPGYGDQMTRYNNGKLWSNMRPSNRISIGSLKHWAKTCDPKKYFNIARGGYLRLLTGNPCGVNSNALCELFVNEMAGDIMFSVSDKDFYMYDPATTLWKCGGGVRALINQIFVDVTQRAIIKILEGMTNQADTEQRKSLIKVIARVDGKNAVNLVNDYLPAFCIPDEDPLTYFDNNADLLPLKNGVWKFSEKRLIPYEREHYFTHKIDIVYDPNADSSLIERAMNDWFKGDKTVIDFIQMYIGYILTGNTNRQEFMVAWGDQAGNGKSLLWGEIIPSLLSKRYYARITSDAFADTGNPNNDQLYYLNGVRYAFMSEPRRGQKNAIDNELLKTITGDKDFTAQAKYKNKLTFKLMAKIVCACNDLPDFNCDDKGTWRRFLALLQNVSCLDKEEYDSANKALKADRSVILKDDAFVKQLLADTKGTMKWALEGAKRYIDNPRMDPPEAMKSAKMKAKESIDTLSHWLRGNLQAGEKSLSFSALKSLWREKGLNFEQNKKGFAGRLENKIKLLGYTVDTGRAGKSEEKVLKCSLVPDTQEPME
jgi:P4 family phage/plasmid primase-like protien